MLLLQIETTPAKYELEINHARLDLKTDMQPSAKVKTEPLQMQMQSDTIAVRIDTYEARKSLGYSTMGDQIRTRAAQVKEHANQAIRDTVTDGAQMAKIEDGVTIGQIITQKTMEQPASQTVFLPAVGAQIEWSPGGLSIRFDPGEMTYDWDVMKHTMDYIPGSVRLKIVEYPDVDIKYVGEPIYVPPSAAPNA